MKLHRQGAGRSDTINHSTSHSSIGRKRLRVVQLLAPFDHPSVEHLFGTPLGNSNVCAAFAELAPHMPVLKWAHLSRRRLRLDAFALILPVVNASRKVFSLDTSTLHACCKQHTVDMNMCIEGLSLMVALPLCDVVDSSSITAELSCDPSCTRSALSPSSISPPYFP